MTDADLTAASAAAHPEREAGTGRVFRYPAVAIALHWLIAFGIIGMIALGWTMGEIKDRAQAYALIQIHKSIGLTILFLTLARIVWRLMNPPPPEPVMPPLQSFAARAVHIGFYALMILMPLSGWIMVSASPTGITTRYFDLAIFAHLPGLPDLSDATKKSLHEPIEFVHSKLAWVAIGLLVLHVVGALKHQFADKDHLLARMAPGLFGPTAGPATAPRGAIPAAAAALALLAAGLIGGSLANGSPPPTNDADASQALASASGPAWTVDPARSSVIFRSAYMGRPLEGRFSDWTADIRFDPAKPEEARVRVTFPLASARTGDDYFDGTLADLDWFAVAKTPNATFDIMTGARHLDGNRYEADGILTLRGASHPVKLPFMLDIAGAEAHMRSDLTLQRLALGVGGATLTEPKGEEEYVANDVGIVIDLVATRAQ
jgi:cytochrome b561